MNDKPVTATVTQPMHVTESTTRVSCVIEWMADHGHQLPEHHTLHIDVQDDRSTVWMHSRPGAIDRTRERFGEPWQTAALGGGARSATWMPFDALTLYVIERPEVAS